MEDSREKDRDRSRRGDRPSRFSDANRDRSNDRGASDCKRLFVSNIPYEYRWTELKDLFKEKVGEVSYVELFNDDNGKPKGCGVVEFANSDAMKRALSVMHRFELNGRKLVLKEETGNERARSNNPQRGGGGGPGGNRHNGPRDDKDNWQNMNMNNSRGEPENFTTYGLSLQFLESINVQPPLVKKVFVANLDYKVDRAKIKEIFKIAGKVRNIDLAVDKDGNSRGFAVVEYDHPVEAVQAISMFDKQTLFDRRMTVRMDRSVDKSEFRLPEGLKGIGLGLGPNGEPLRDVANNLPQNQNQNNNMNMVNNPSMGGNVMNAVPNAGLNLNGMGAGLAANSLNATAGMGANLGLQQALGLTSLGALQNQLLQQGLTATDLASVLTQANLNTSLINPGTDMTMLANSSLTNSMLANNASLSSGLNTANLATSGIGTGLNPTALTTQIGGNSSSNNMRSMSTSQSYNSISSSINDYKDSKSMYNRESTSQLSSRDSKTSDMVVITNLPPTVTWQLIMEKFSECGEVKYAEMTAKDTAIVRFLKEWDADRAIKMFDRTRIDGRTIDVRFF